VANAGWLEPEEGWCPNWEPGTVVLDKRSGLLMEIVETHCDRLYEGHRAWRSTAEGCARYFSFRVVFFDDQTDPTDGCWRAPEDLVALTEMEIVALAAR
jgi:hypothetical protein